MAFKLDPSISWGDIGMGVGLLLTGVIAFTDVTSQVAVHDERITAIGSGATATREELRLHVQQEAVEREAVRQELRGDLREINSKLDKLIDRELARPPGR